MNVGVTFRGFGNAREDFQQRALPCSVAADDADDFTMLNVEADVFEGPDVVGRR